jgi:DNA topoisomerase I
LGPPREAAAPVEVVTPEPEPEAKKAKGKAKAKAKPKDAPKPKRVSLPKGMPPAEIDLETALKLLALPRDVGPHPETGEMISAGIGRFGPYLKLGSTYKSLAADDDVLSIGLNRAVVLLAEAKKGPAQVPGRVVGDHPRDGKPVSLNNGRFGPYVKHGKVMASLPKAMAANADELTLQQAVELLDAKIAKDGGKIPAAKAAKGKAAKPEASSDDAGAEPKASKKPAAEKKAAAPKAAPKKAAAKATEAVAAKPKARAAG